MIVSRTIKSWNFSTWPDVLSKVRLRFPKRRNALEDNVGREVRAVNLEHVLLQHEVLTPESEEIGLRNINQVPRCSTNLNGATGRAVVIETLHTTVDAEGGAVEEAMLQELLKAGAAKRRRSARQGWRKSTD